MSRELDRRDHSVNRLTSGRETHLRGLSNETSERLPGDHRIDITSFNAATGNPAVVASEAAPAEKGDYIRRALQHVQRIGPALGLTADQPAEFTPDPHYQTTSSGAVAVHLQQRYKGIPVFQATETVRFDPEGRLSETAGSSFTMDENGDLSPEPQLPAAKAVELAALHVAVPGEDEIGATDPFGEPIPAQAVDVAGFQPTVLAAFPETAEKSAVFAPGPFGDQIKSSLTWFPLDGVPRLAWEVLLTMPEYQGQYRTLVDAREGEILYCRQLIPTVLARGNVFARDGDGARQLVDFPRPLADYGLPFDANALPAGFPDSWVEADRTLGNSVRARLGSAGNPIAGAPANGILAFNPADDTGDEQKVLNIFYYNCFMHDYFYLLGFRERDGNFQHDNLGRGGTATDRVDARAHSGPVFGTANMATPVDGSSPVMNMGLVSSTNRHTAFDSSVVFHEFMHGVTNRLVGGPMDVRALEEPQSAGMGEGWGDYIACTINGDTVVGSWVVNRPDGIRGFPYTGDFPDSFADLGTGRYDEVHNLGEIWCATLLEMNRRIGNVPLAVQLVVDALKLSPSNPSFLDMRDAILRALDNKLAAGQLAADERARVKTAIWAAFARFGMGPGARSNGPSLSGIVADFNPPAQPAGSGVQVEATPNLPVPDNEPGGVASTLAVQDAGRIARLSVSVEVQHTFIGDLRVTLTRPGGATAVLHARSGGGTDNLVRTYTSDDTPALAAFLGTEAQGSWTLQVADLARVDTGTFQRWQLVLDLAQA